jgi:hypothetical protein
MISRFGEMKVASDHLFCKPTSGVFISPYMQDLMVFSGCTDVFASVPEQLSRLLRVDISTSSVYRVTMAVSETLSEDDILKPIEYEAAYLQIDGSLISTDDGWKEVKVARVYPRDETGNGELAESRYCAHLGSHTDFMEKVKKLVPSSSQLVVLSDGAPWIEKEIDENYPGAVKILDYYHVAEHLSEAVHGVALPEQWLEKQMRLLLESKSLEVLDAVESLPGIDKKRAHSLRNYYTNNQQRMDYKSFKFRGYAIGSGAIEAAHKTLIQIRMKRSGQRWSPTKAPLILQLRVAYKSRQWAAVEKVLNKA